VDIRAVIQQELKKFFKSYDEDTASKDEIEEIELPVNHNPNSKKSIPIEFPFKKNNKPSIQSTSNDSPHQFPKNI
jgi:hypothetical protein